MPLAPTLGFATWAPAIKELENFCPAKTSCPQRVIVCPILLMHLSRTPLQHSALADKQSFGVYSMNKPDNRESGARRIQDCRLDWTRNMHQKIWLWWANSFNVKMSCHSFCNRSRTPSTLSEHHGFLKLHSSHHANQLVPSIYV